MKYIKTIMLFFLFCSVSQAETLSIQEKDLLINSIYTYKYKTLQQKQEDLADYYTTVASMIKNGDIAYNRDFTQDFVDFICSYHPNNCNEIVSGETNENLNLRNDLLIKFYESDSVKSETEEFMLQIMPTYLKKEFDLQSKKIVICDNLISKINAGEIQIQKKDIEFIIKKVQTLAKKNVQAADNKELNDYFRYDGEFNSFIENLLDKESQ